MKNKTELKLIAKINYCNESIKFSCCEKGNDQPLYDCLGNQINPINNLLEYHPERATAKLSSYPIKVFSCVDTREQEFREIEFLTNQQEMMLIIPKNLYNDCDQLTEWLHDSDHWQLEKLIHHNYANYQGLPDTFLAFTGWYDDDGDWEDMTHISKNLFFS